MFDRQFKSHTPQAAGTAKQSQVGPFVLAINVVKLDLHSARFAPVKYLFTRKGLVRASVRKPEGEPIEARIENAIEVALPFVDDFSQNSKSGETVELEVR
jgi:hypothetical protein